MVAKMTENELGHAAIGAALRVHSVLGPSLLENVYELSLAHELRQQGLLVQRQRSIPVRYGDLTFEHGYRIDVLVNDKVVIELKAIESILPVHRSQLLSYLRLGGYRLGYLFNFHVSHMREGITRMVNGL